LIEAKHPLKTAHISHVWGFMEFFSCFTGKPKTSFKVALKKSLRHKLDLKMPSSELMVENDPFLRMGKYSRFTESHSSAGAFPQSYLLPKARV
jgi:hypothetical protein